ncbi:uncharacterized protein ALTATR162_LOCUS9459 [Alternaria atra]|uniref:uracil phosphoribosyltransferase n=1 Tax=Alternaria atra TaxID=119953 RepID=A0A8J2I7K8_9PLEO|nr:uncharacterized protein ALTATR162_LOCUS9459 [Alternaria atra]CAG5180833.1 unnamed protein product [Alternaria atra]
MSAINLPKNAHVSTHPCLQAKLSQLRSASTGSKDAQTLVHELALMVGYEALAAGLKAQEAGTQDCIFPIADKSSLGYEYTATTTSPSPTSISLVPILRSGLSMVPALSSLLPSPVPIHHLGLYREKSTLQPVEYYNNLPYHTPHAAGSTKPQPELAIIVDPIIATGATAQAAIDTLKDWGVKRIIVVAILATEEGLHKACGEWEEGVEVWVGGCDKEVDEKGMIKPDYTTDEDTRTESSSQEDIDKYREFVLGHNKRFKIESSSQEDIDEYREFLLYDYGLRRYVLGGISKEYESRVVWECRGNAREGDIFVSLEPDPCNVVLRKCPGLGDLFEVVGWGNRMSETKWVDRSEKIERSDSMELTRSIYQRTRPVKEWMMKDEIWAKEEWRPDHAPGPRKRFRIR